MCEEEGEGFVEAAISAHLMKMKKDAASAWQPEMVSSVQLGKNMWNA